MSDGSRVGGLVLAAGASRRFGGIKQLAPFWGRPLIEWAVGALLDSQLPDVMVVLGEHAETIERAADLAGTRIIRNPDWENGQSSSLAAGLLAAQATDLDAMVVVLGDQPLVSPGAVSRVVRSFEGRPARAVYGSRAGHPTVIPRDVWDRILSTGGDSGAAAVLGEVGFLAVPCEGLGSCADVDTVEDLQLLSRRATVDGSFRSRRGR